MSKELTGTILRSRTSLASITPVTTFSPRTKHLTFFVNYTVRHFIGSFVPGEGHLPICFQEILMPRGSPPAGGWKWTLLEMTDALPFCPVKTCSVGEIQTFINNSCCVKGTLLSLLVFPFFWFIKKENPLTDIFGQEL